MSRVCLGDIAVEHKETCKGNKEGYPVVGLEHLTPGEITLTEWDESGDNTFTKVFRKGNVLFGRRRAYLKKAAVAPFDGVCSGDITVIEARQDKVLPELLPFIIQNDALFAFAVEKSAGSLSPRVKWEHLKNFEFELPEMSKQRTLAEVLWSIDATKKAYQKLIKQTDELVKSQFMEMFGDPTTNPMDWEIKPLYEVAEYFIGLTYRPSDIAEQGTIVLRSGNIQDSKLDFGDVVRVNLEVRKQLYVHENDILMCSRNGSADLVGKVAKIPKMTENMTFGAFMTIIRTVYHDYIFSYFQTDAFRSQINTGKTATINQITKAMLDKVILPLPPLPLQQQFAAFVRQTDKSKFALLNCSNLNLWRCSEGKRSHLILHDLRMLLL